MSQATTGAVRNPYKNADRSTSYSITGVGVGTTNNNIAGNLSGRTTPASILTAGGSTHASVSGWSTPSTVPTNAKARKNAPKKGSSYVGVRTCFHRPY